ncbi:MAG: hypothetical protein U1E17_08050 [Geminicoccaceae bacterium]
MSGACSNASTRVPMLVQRYARLLDIRRRLELGEDAEARLPPV